ncbi:MAG: hypothetical protein DRJ69_00345 [Thermoprotei archaeon]|nr:MAG: hypothetical protein DRJ69_00345 [Thermoprotei archaeon]
MMPRTLYPLLLLAFLFCIIATVKATITITDVSPQDGAKHVDITDNPPDPGGYVRLSLTLIDNTGNDDMEFWLDIWNGTAWVNRIHQAYVSSPYTVTQDEYSFNHTATTYKWRILTKDWTDNTWNNQTFTFTTDKYPSPPECIYPENNSLVEAGEIVLKVKVNHPDNPYGAKIYNVTFHEYPSGRLIGWNATSTGWDNGTIVTCNQTFLAMYPATNYYWYAVAHDDEYNTSSPVFMFKTNFTEIEPSKSCYAVGSTIYIEGVYTEPEPPEACYAVGSVINIYYPIELKFPHPANNSVNVSVNPNLGIWAYKNGEQGYWNFTFYANDTINETWHQVNDKVQVLLGYGANNLTINDNLSKGEFSYTVYCDNLTLTSERANTNYNPNWKYYQVLKINNNGYTGYYQMKLNVSYRCGGDVSCYGRCQEDFDDLRFVQIDNSTELPYWIERKVDGQYAIVWINVSSQAMNDGKILMYYGNPSASSASNGDNTFLFFDDFEDGTSGEELSSAKWPYLYGIWKYYQDGDRMVARYEGGASDGNVRAINNVNISGNFTVESLVKGISNKDMAILICSSDDTTTKYGDNYWIGWGSGGSKAKIYYFHDASYDLLTETSNNVPTDYTKVRITHKDNGQMKLYKENTEIVSTTDTRYTYGYIGISTWYSCTNNPYFDWIFVRKYADPEPEWNIQPNYAPSGYRISPVYNLSGRAKSTKLTYVADIPTGTSLKVYYNLSEGSSWTGWKEIANGGSIPEITDGEIIDGYKIKFKIVLETTDSSKTPSLSSLKLRIERYTYVEVPYSGLQIFHRYWWYVNATRFGSTFTTPIYTFETGYYEEEPSRVCYAVGSTIYIEGIYTEPEPSRVCYAVGSQIRVIYTVEFSNPTPPDGATGVTENTPLLSVYVSCPTQKEIQVTFQQNDSGEWRDIPPTIVVTTNATVSNYHYQLQYGKTYYWRVRAYNVSADKTWYSPVYNFTTREYNDTEPSKICYAVGSTIYIEGIYTEPEPSRACYAMGSSVVIGKPSVSDPYPPDNSTFGRHFISSFSVYVEDPDNQNLTVSFYYDSTCWATAYDVPSGSRAEVPPPPMTNGTTIHWYVTVNDSHGWNITSPTWSYTPQNQPPYAEIKPKDGDSFVEVRRKIDGWQPFVRLMAIVNDTEHDRLTVQIYVDDPSQPNWNDWIMRLSHVLDNYSYYSINPYIQDELAFNELDTTYHWWLHLEDEYGATADYYANFTTKFFFYAYFTYYPEHPTQEDVVHFIDKSENATDIAWYINGERVAYKNFTSGKHKPFNLTYRFNVSGIYNVTLWIHNDTADATDFYYEIIYVDWNLTLNRTKGGAGINYATIPFNVSLFNLSKVLLKNSEWIHYYDSINKTWLSAMKFNNSILGDNITLDRWSSIAIVVGEDRKVRINISDFITTPEPTNFTQRKTIHKGYWYLGWSGDKGIDSYNLSKIGLEEGDWVFAYDTINGTWYSYKINFAGDKFIIKPHHVIIALVSGDRDIVIPRW